MLNAPRHDLARPVRAVETMTASVMMGVPVESLGSCRQPLNVLPSAASLRQQRRRLPERRIGVRIGRETRHAAHDVVQTQHVGVEHRSAAMQRKAVAGQVDHVDIGRALRDAFVEDARAFVDQREDAALDDLVRRRSCAARCRAPCDSRRSARRPPDRATASRLPGFIAIPALPGLLAEASELAQPVGDLRVHDAAASRRSGACGSTSRCRCPRDRSCGTAPSPCRSSPARDRLAAGDAPSSSRNNA